MSLLSDTLALWYINCFLDFCLISLNQSRILNTVQLFVSWDGDNDRHCHLLSSPWHAPHNRAAAPVSCSAGTSQRGVTCPVCPQRRTWSCGQRMLAGPLSAGPEGHPACPACSRLYHRGRTPPAPREV